VNNLHSTMSIRKAIWNLIYVLQFFDIFNLSSSRKQGMHYTRLETRLLCTTEGLSNSSGPVGVVAEANFWHLQNWRKFEKLFKSFAMWLWWKTEEGMFKFSDFFAKLKLKGSKSKGKTGNFSLFLRILRISVNF
jgi:hypothetical protein